MEWVTCPKCDGKRIIHPEGKRIPFPCPVCKGDGEMLTLTLQEIKILIGAIKYQEKNYESPPGEVCVEMAFPWMLKSLNERMEREEEAFRKVEEADDYTDTETYAVRKYGKEIGKWVSGKLMEAIKETGDHCIDNERVCEIGNPEDMVAYERQRETGCCGFHDEEIDHSSGRKFFIGFNYGH